MTIQDFTDSAFPKDVVIHRRNLPLLAFMVLFMLTSAVWFGLYFGSRAADDDHAEERAKLATDYAAQLKIKDEQITTLTDQLITLQKTTLERADATTETLKGITEILNLVAAGAQLNKDAAAELRDKVAKIAARPTAVVVRPLAAPVAPARPPSHAPRRAPVLGPPPEALRPAAGDMPIGGPQ